MLTPEQFFEGISHPASLARLKQIETCPLDLPDNVGKILCIEDAFASLRKKYRRNKWPGKTQYIPREGWARIEDAVKETGISRSWFYERFRDKTLKNCEKGPEKVKGGCVQMVWRVEPEEAIELWHAMGNFHGGAPDRLIIDGITYASISFLSRGDARIIDRVGATYRQGRLDGFKRRYSGRHVVYVKERLALTEIQKYKERRTKRQENEGYKIRIVSLLRKGSTHIRVIHNELEIVERRTRRLVKKLIDDGKIERDLRYGIGWYKIVNST